MFKRSLEFEPFNRFLLFIEGEDDEGGGGEGSEGDPPADPPADPPVGEGADDWRAVIKDDKLRDLAGKYTTLDALTKANMDFRKELSTSIRLPKEDSTDEQVADFRKKMGIPETIEGYEFTVPEGHELTEADTEFHKAAATLFHENNISTEQAHGITEWWNEYIAAIQQTQIESDMEFAAEAEIKLKAEWPGQEFDRNKAFANDAASKVFGDQLDEVRNIETKDGRFILDHPAFIKMLAQYGREMQEGSLGNIMTESQRGDLEGEIDALEKKIEQALQSGDRSTANDLYQTQQELYRKSYGAGGIVGAGGRVV
jgi:hypothetical protein